MLAWPVRLAYQKTKTAIVVSASITAAVRLAGELIIVRPRILVGSFQQG